MYDLDKNASIRELIFNSRGKLNPRSSTLSWWIDRGVSELFYYMMEATSFIPPYAIKGYARRIYCLLNALESEPICGVCSGVVKYNAAKKAYNKTCKLHAYNNDVERKRISTMMARYGEVKNFSNPSHHRISVQTMVERYGTENVNVLPVIREKREATNLARYGKPNYTQSDGYNARRMASTTERYGVEHTSMLSEFKTIGLDHHMYKEWRESAEEIRTAYEIDKMPKCDVAKKFNYSLSHMNKIILALGMDGDLPQNKVHVKSFVSKNETIIGDILEAHGISIYRNVRNLIGEELDIYIPELKKAVEYNGDYWHSDKIRDKKHVIAKLEKCEALGINLITIQEHVFKQRQDAIISKLVHKIEKTVKKCYARKTTFRKITGSEANTFFDLHHVQASKQKSPEHYALFLGEIPVAVASFKKFRDAVEIVRYATSMSVVGGLSKIISNSPFDKVYSFADRRYTFRPRNIYTESGFAEMMITPQSYVYVRGNVVLSRQQAMKHKLSRILKRFDPARTEYENMSNHGFVRVWDCGHLLYCYRKGT
jgi:hypothetical protein